MWENIQPFAIGFGLLLFAVGFVWALAAIAKKIKPESGSAQALQSAILFLSVFEDALVSVVGEQWKVVYDAILKAMKSLADGNISEDEAQESAKEVFDAAVALSKVVLTEEQREFAYKILAKGVKYVVSDKDSAAKALSLRM